MKEILDDLGVEYTIGIGEAAFYGPKLDVQYKNVFGKEDTIVTIQIDMLLAEKFGMYYTDSDSQKKLPYIIHRTSLGCYERTLAFLIEKYAGALPTWMSPEQVRILTITDRAAEYADKVYNSLTSKKYRVQLDDSQNTLKYKIRNAQLEKVPYMIILGDKDIENNTVSVRHRSGEDLGSISLEEFEAILGDVVSNKLKK
jgi:threonyl-tRNA synthetase